MTPDPPYHERQGSLNQLCLIHALNMIFGQAKVSKDELDQICTTILAPESSWWNNPHKSWTGDGNYDVNVALYTLQKEGYETSYFDGRKTESDLLNEVFENGSPNSATSLLVNIPGGLSWMSKTWSRHWIAYRYYSEEWWLLDSKQRKPVVKTMLFQDTIKNHLDDSDTIIIIRSPQQT